MLKKALILTCLALLIAPVGAEEMTVDEVVESYIEAMGGRDAWNEVKTAKMTGKMVMGGQMEMPISVVYQRPGKVRMEMEMQGQKIVQAYDGEEGWQIMPLMGKTEPQKMTEDEAKTVKSQSDFEGPLFDYKDKGHTVKLMGIEEVEGTEAYKLEITLETGDVTYSYLDTESFLEFQQEGKTRAQTGQEVKTTTILGDYKEIGSLLLAHSREIKPEGAPQSLMIVIESVELNPEGVDDEQFAMPAVEPAAEAEAEGEKSDG